MSSRVAGVVALAASLAASPLPAHVFLEQAVPGAGSVLHDGPAALVLRFDGRVEAQLSSIVLEAADGTRIPLPPPAAADGGSVLRAPLPPLAPGRYRVRWTATGADGHVTRGGYAFRIAAPGAAAAR